VTNQRSGASDASLPKRSQQIPRTFFGIAEILYSSALAVDFPPRGFHDFA
jgi:hypothetical protein